MNDASFNLAMQALGIARSFLALHDWAEFDARCGRADAAGAILDPTLYREAMDILPLLREAGQAAARFTKLVEAFEVAQEKRRAEMRESELRANVLRGCEAAVREAGGATGGTEVRG